MVTADGNDDIIGEPMIVHCLIGSLCRLATYRVKGRNRARSDRYFAASGLNGPRLWNPDLPSDVDDLLHEMQDLRVLDPLRDFIPGSTECRIVSKYTTDQHR